MPGATVIYCDPCRVMLGWPLGNVRPNVICEWCSRNVEGYELDREVLLGWLEVIIQKMQTVQEQLRENAVEREPGPTIWDRLGVDF